MCSSDLLIRRNAHGIESRRERLNRNRADDGTGKIEFTAAETVAAEGYREDRIELHVESDIVCIARIDTARRDEACEARCKSAKHIAKKDDERRIDADEPTRFRIYADRFNIHAERDFSEQQRRRDDENSLDRKSVV